MKVVDMHCDTIGAIYENNLKGNNYNLKDNKLHLDINKLIKGDYLLQNFAMFIDIKHYTDPYKTLLEMIDCFNNEINCNSEIIKQVTSYSEILSNKKDNKISALLTIEDGGALLGSLDNLETVYNKGVRMITLTWNYPNGIGFPNFILKEDKNTSMIIKPDLTIPNTKDGLTSFGKSFVERMSELGIIIDVSHLSDAGFYDVLDITDKPFVASHSNSRSITNVVRNMTDDMIKKLANRGGVLGINFCSSFIEPTPHFNPTFTKIDDIIAHIKYIRKIGGIDCIGLGSDFDGIPSTLELENGSHMPKLCDALYKNGFTTTEIEKIFYKNVLNLYKELL